MDETEGRGQSWWSSLTADRRAAVGVFGVGSILALVLSVVYWRYEVHSPFIIPKDLMEQKQAILAKQDADARQLEEMKTKDTDHDSLSDYDELFVYGTSPYLADSDSDGIPDGVEIARGSDPNCPEGKTCYQAEDYVSGKATSTPEDNFNDLLAVPQVPKLPASLTSGADAADLSGTQQFLASPPAPAGMTAAQIRDYLINNHMVTKDQLDQLPDSAVIEVYQRAYDEAGKIQAAQALGAAAAASSTVTPTATAAPANQ